MESVQGINKCLLKLQEHIGLDMNGRPTWYDAPTHKKAWKKFAVSLAKKDHYSILEKLDKDNRIITSLTRDSIELEPGRSSRSRGREPFGNIRECARSLHNVLKASWPCTCTYPHSADMRLEIRDHLSDLSFRILFAPAVDLHTTQLQGLTWQETEIRPVDLRAEEGIGIPQSNRIETHDVHDPMLPTGYNVNTDTAVVSSTLQSSSIGRPFLGKCSLFFEQLKKNIWTTEDMSWAVDVQGEQQGQPHAQQGVTSQGAISPGTEKEANSGSTANIERIANLCHALRDAQSKQKHEECFGRLIGESYCFSVYSMFSNPVKAFSRQGSTTLNDLLNLSFDTHSQAEGTALPLTKRSRLRIAVTLVSTALQLHDTPWLKKTWGKKDVLFHDGSAEYPYISKTFAQGNSGVAEAISIPATGTSWTPIRNESVFNLGVLLLELAYGKPLLSFQNPNDPPFFTEYAIASRLVNHLVEEESSGYVDAARACIYCDFGTKVKKLGFDNEAFKQAVYDNVLVPLEDDWKHWNRSY
ncbi:uncharacterized protein KY384_000477 [Bacidia gigantensis]|uniref:uncharacterized protein n=1 Tax=Bacidia gigantensis TaxID=2732470 RepID=UPI001D038CFA|nr:uncharacterized protein KY384_000477 [Bacidia gigantensis]KAG8525717.1 hypothetical protein KY384_000477 [Bacidia gigantensis]